MQTDDRTGPVALGDMLAEIERDPKAWAARMAAQCREAHADDPPAPVLSPEEVNARRLQAVGFGRRYCYPTWEKVFADGREVLRAYAEDIGARIAEGRGLMILGGLGRGKTHALALLALAACGKHDVAYILAPDLYDLLHRTDPEARAKADYYREVDLLLLDDADRVYSGGEWAMARFDGFMEHRHANMRATCVTVNDFGTLRDQPLLARTLDRWRETMELVRTQAPSQRIPLAGEAGR